MSSFLQSVLCYWESANYWVFYFPVHLSTLLTISYHHKHGKGNTSSPSQPITARLWYLRHPDVLIHFSGGACVCVCVCVCVWEKVYVLPGCVLRCLQVVWTGWLQATGDLALLHTSSRSSARLHTHTQTQINSTVYSFTRAAFTLGGVFFFCYRPQLTVLTW